jgi:hypothetical protein
VDAVLGKEPLKPGSSYQSEIVFVVVALLVPYKNVIKAGVYDEPPIVKLLDGV